MPNEMMSFANFTPDTPVSIATSEQTVGLSVNDVLKWIEPKAPPKEALRFLLACRASNLNPFLGEAYLVEMGGKWATVIAKAGYLKRAQTHPDFDGIESGVVVQEQARDRVGNLIPGRKTGPLIELEGEIVPEGFFLVGGWAKVYRRGISRPFKSQVSYAEYIKAGSPTWKQYPCTMIVKVALTHAIKEAFAIGDSYHESEMDHARPQRSAAQAAELQKVMEARVVGGGSPAFGEPRQIGNLYGGADDPSLPVEMMGKIAEYRGKIGIDDDQWAALMAKAGVAHVSGLSIVQAQTLIRYLQGVAGRAEFFESALGPPANPEPASVIPNVRPLDQEIMMTVEGEGGYGGASEGGDGTTEAGELAGASASGTGKYATLPTHEIED